MWGYLTITSHCQRGVTYISDYYVTRKQYYLKRAHKLDRRSLSSADFSLRGVGLSQAQTKAHVSEEFASAAAIFCLTAAIHGLLIFNFRMRERSVLGWRPRRLAAACGPSIRHLQAARARMM